MFSRMHSKLGTAGLVVAIVALFTALTGAAFAANAALSSKQTKEVKKIAKQFAGKPGKDGAPGPQGQAGSAGKDGSNGTNGSNGADGKSVKVANEATGTGNCGGLGGASVEVEGSGTKKFVCNGQTGFTATLPPGEAETGVWSAINATGSTPSVLLNFSFNIPLADGASYAANWINAAGEAKVGSLANCPGTAAEAKAEPGNLCVYTTNAEEVATPENMTFIAEEGEGSVAIFNLKSGGSAFGTWAVAAPTS